MGLGKPVVSRVSVTAAKLVDSRLI
jgi:hypothetical protein